MTNPNTNPSESGSFFASAIAGVLVAIGLVILAQAVFWLLIYLVPDLGFGEGGFGILVAWYSVGWTQLAYLPIYIIVQNRRGNTRHAKGAIGVSAILFFITCACNSGVITL